MPKQKEDLTIGELARMTGISVHTLRIWERRYGAPQARRLPSGHRRYSRDEVPRLRAIAQAVEAGFRPGKVVGGSVEEIQNLLLPGPRPTGENRAETPEDPVRIEGWLEAVHNFDEDSLTQGFYSEWGRRGPLAFISDLAVPFLRKIGAGWLQGELGVAQEHFASQRLGDFLSGQWRRLNERKQNPAAVLATLPGETHQLGLQMCAVVTALAPLKVVYLGPDTPEDEILTTVGRSRGELLCLSISVCAEEKGVAERVRRLGERLPGDTRLVIGGGGAPDAIERALRFANFQDYYDWLAGGAV